MNNRSCKHKWCVCQPHFLCFLMAKVLRCSKLPRFKCEFPLHSIHPFLLESVWNLPTQEFHRFRRVSGVSRGTFAFIKVLSGSKTGQGILCRLCQDVRMHVRWWYDHDRVVLSQKASLERFWIWNSHLAAKKNNKMRTKISNISWTWISLK